MIGIPLGLLYSNAAEWWIHKHVLHGDGKRKGSWWSFHFHEHHQAARSQEMHDPGYLRPLFGRHAQGREAIGVALLMAAHVPLLPVAPFFTATVWYSAVRYHRMHKRSHLDVEWGKRHMPWHYDHHMGPDQDQNWGVTRDWIDRMVGSRVPYLGTPVEARDRARRLERMARKARRTVAAPTEDRVAA